MDNEIPEILEQDARDIPDVGARVINLRPRLGRHEARFRQFCREVARATSTSDSAAKRLALESLRVQIQRSAESSATKGRIAFSFACSVVVDMVAQGWGLEIRRKDILIKSPPTAGITPEELKRRIRESHLLERDEQLREPSVRAFITEMEQKRLGPKGWVSIFSLMRDGRELAAKLREAAADAVLNRRGEVLRTAVAPYLQLVEAGVRCELTGLLLTDIWRYFRHTWVSTYKSLPGRSMMVLIRDAAAQHHPVIGIAALGSSMAQQRLRDRWIGWDSEVFVENLIQNPTQKFSRWVQRSVERLLDAVYVQDFLKEGVLTRADIKAPTPRVIERLLRVAEKATSYHVLNPEAAKHKNATSANGVDWRRQAETGLFRAKRARTLAKLLGIRQALRAEGVRDESAESIRNALAGSACRAAIRQLVRAVKAEHVGVDMMDIIVCGAIPPYNAVLGGKLVCMLLTGPEVVQFYRSRYGNQSSVIASSMKGRTVVRPPNLVLLATTSLYGVGSSQYNRVRIPLEEVGGRLGRKLEYYELGISVGYGSYHFTGATIDYLETLLGRAGDGRKVNSIFGEGVNPLMRKIREGLALVDLPSDELLRHGNSRVVYGIVLAENFRDVLLGLAGSPRYLLPIREAAKTTQRIADFWRKRWLSGRITRPGILEEVEKHTLSYPVGHGARVILPTDGQLEFFEHPR